jgi:serine/threonine protein phosphatase PrpC
VLVKFDAKAQGISHIEKDLPCQDAATAKLGLNNTIGIACVADGHGGSKYFRSDKGSIIAVQVAEKALLDFFATIAKEKTPFYNSKASNESGKSIDVQERLKDLEGNIIYNWRNAVARHIEKTPFAETEIEHCKKNNIPLDYDPEKMMFAYGSTLLAGLVSDNFWFAIQIGDGLCVVLESEEKITVPIGEDERLAFGVTTSLCDSNAKDNFREAYGFAKIEGLTVATDGITDSFIPEKYLQFNKGLYEKFAHPSSTVEEEQKKLQEFLPEVSQRGSRDDIAIAGIFRVKEQQ